MEREVLEIQATIRGLADKEEFPDLKKFIRKNLTDDEISELKKLLDTLWAGQDV